MSETEEAPLALGLGLGSAARELERAARTLNIHEGEPAAVVFNGFTRVCEALDATAERVSKASTISQEDLEKALRAVARPVLTSIGKDVRESASIQARAIQGGIYGALVLVSLLAGMLAQNVRASGLEERLGATCLQAATQQQGGGIACSIWISPPRGR